MVTKSAQTQRRGVSGLRGGPRSRPSSALPRGAATVVAVVVTRSVPRGSRANSTTTTPDRQLPCLSYDAAHTRPCSVPHSPRAAASPSRRIGHSASRAGERGPPLHFPPALHSPQVGLLGLGGAVAAGIASGEVHSRTRDRTTWCIRRSGGSVSHSDVTVMRWASRPASSTPAYDVAHKEWWLPEPLRCNRHASGELDPGV